MPALNIGAIYLAVCATFLLGSLPAAILAGESGHERAWALGLQNLLANGTTPLVIYARERDGAWVSGLGSSRDPVSKRRKYNLSNAYIDLTKAPIVDGRMKGPVTAHMAPDLWVPQDHKSFTIECEVDAKVDEKGNLDGTYQVLAVNTTDKSAEGISRKGGRFTGSGVVKDQEPIPAKLTYALNLHGALVGGKPSYGARAMAMWLGVEDDRIITASQGRLTGAPKGGVESYGRKNFRHGSSTVKRDRERLTAQIIVPDQTLDYDPCVYVFDLIGAIHDKNINGTYVVTAKREGQPDQRFNGVFDGSWSPDFTKWGVDEEGDLSSWFTAVKDFTPVAPGEHPRLLFRRSALPALRERAKTPEGQAIIKRLGFILDGKEGRTMAPVASDATKPYSLGKYQSKEVAEIGIYTFSHVVGYGLLYQLTGDKLYADLGRQCFDKALAGTRDRDDRYSWRDPGGALRTGPTLGWYAVGYDLCYDGWDPATRERIAKEIEHYRASATDAEGEIIEGASIDLEDLSRGQGIPGSNHFGMVIGGASLALLAIAGDPGVDTRNNDRLLKLAYNGLVRNITEGFGDGGYFKEGDGTGSMASFISYLSALKAWQNVKGQDFFAASRPNATMLTLKWIYQSVVRPQAMLKANQDRQRKDPAKWMVNQSLTRDERPTMVMRGAYDHNIWARTGLSGGGYFAIGFGALTPPQRAAMVWYYDHFLKEFDEKIGMPFDTVSVYPHHAVSAFVNWPFDLKPVNPAEVLPLCYRDTEASFYVWRNRWKDENDTVITAMTGSTKGYYQTKADKQFMLLCQGRQVAWGTVGSGTAKAWKPSPRGETSSLTMGDGTAFAVDFSGTSGMDVLLVTTGKAEGVAVKLGDRVVTFHCPTMTTPPNIQVEGTAAVVGQQRVEVTESGDIVFARPGK